MIIMFFCFVFASMFFFLGTTQCTSRITVRRVMRLLDMHLQSRMQIHGVARTYMCLDALE
jgi:hypothetical protein